MPATTMRPSAPVGSSALRILIVDDSAADAELLDRALRKALGAEQSIFVADSAAEALRIAREFAVDVALVDYRLPDQDGLALLGEIAKLGTNTATVLMTGQGSETVAVRAMKQGAHDYLVKRDISAATVGDVVRQALRAAGEQHDRRQSTQRIHQAHHEMDHLVRALSHDMSANFMLLENSFQHLKHTWRSDASQSAPHDVAHVEACLEQSKRFLDDLGALASSGGVSMASARVELSRVLAEIIYEQRELFIDRGVQVSVEPALPAVWCHENRVKQVLTNLVRNAVKHGCDAQRPKLSISRLQDAQLDPAGQFVWLRLHDNGPGIPATSREEIFLPGRRLANAHAEGSGMGLAIAKKIVDHYGGRIYVESICTDGTAFVVSFPAVVD